MSASDNLHPHQMKLFVDPVEHLNSLAGSVDLTHDPFTGSPNESWGDLWDRKLSESKGFSGRGAGVHTSIAEHGFDMGKPLHLNPASEGGWVQGEGHHRLAAAADIQRSTGRQQWLSVGYSQGALPGNRHLGPQMMQEYKQDVVQGPSGVG